MLCVNFVDIVYLAKSDLVVHDLDSFIDEREA